VWHSLKVNLAIAALAVLSACGPRAPSDAETAARAQAAIAPFKKSLREALMAELAKSPAGAIDVCAETAPALAKEASKAGVRLGRASAKLRNPANAPPGWLPPVMEELAGAPRGTAASRVVDLGDGKRGYAEAIWLDAPCLLCHGTAIAADVEAKIAERYPHDAARGFLLGDFRGVFWAELDPPVD
jgi:hypothetical protein